jgi:hypothetical protein
MMSTIEPDIAVDFSALGLNEKSTPCVSDAHKQSPPPATHAARYQFNCCNNQPVLLCDVHASLVRQHAEAGRDFCCRSCPTSVGNLVSLWKI